MPPATRNNLSSVRVLCLLPTAPLSLSKEGGEAVALRIAHVANLATLLKLNACPLLCSVAEGVVAGFSELPVVPIGKFLV